MREALLQWLVLNGTKFLTSMEYVQYAQDCHRAGTLGHLNAAKDLGYIGYSPYGGYCISPEGLKYLQSDI